MKRCTRETFGAVFVPKVPRMVRSVVLTPIKSSSKLGDLASDNTPPGTPTKIRHQPTLAGCIFVEGGVVSTSLTWLVAVKSSMLWSWLLAKSS